MQVKLNSDNTVTLTVDRAELAVIDYGVGYFAQHASTGIDPTDYQLANALEQQLWTEYCKLVDQMQGKDQSCWPFKLAAEMEAV
jgi:hypothetical protein